MARAGRLAAIAALAVSAAVAALAGQLRLADESDRLAFREWFVFLADAQFARPVPEVSDCAGLVRYAFREALRAHTPEWQRQAAMPLAPAIPDVQRRPAPSAHGWPLFRIGDGRFGEFADAATIVQLNARPLGRDLKALRPGDLLYYHRDSGDMPDHVMVFVGPSRFDAGPVDWVVYHTGPIDGHPGEVRKVRLGDLIRHPVARWRPLPGNPAFVGAFRLNIL
jgi:uncharacterized protein YfaT (DUF1175 family)